MKDRKIGYYLLKTKFSHGEIEQLTHHPKFFGGGEHYLLFSKQVPRNEMLIKVFNRGLAKLKENGKVDQYFEGVLKGEY